MAIDHDQAAFRASTFTTKFTQTTEKIQALEVAVSVPCVNSVLNFLDFEHKLMRME
ncbi:MAG: hypothetical protein JNG89_19415 [Planctomycetaceae bacterium]|nr:hypothetical protein [Planctomycetaceae bacterium]